MNLASNRPAHQSSSVKLAATLPSAASLASPHPLGLSLMQPSFLAARTVTTEYALPNAVRYHGGIGGPSLAGWPNPKGWQPGRWHFVTDGHSVTVS